MQYLVCRCEDDNSFPLTSEHVFISIEILDVNEPPRFAVDEIAMAKNYSTSVQENTEDPSLFTFGKISGLVSDVDSGDIDGLRFS